MARLTGISKNLSAFLDTIAHSELGSLLTVPGSDDGYNVLVGSMPSKPIFFDSYADHPRRKVLIQRLHIWSSAAGRYQFMPLTWDAVARKCDLEDFSPTNQDLGCIQLIDWRGALQLVECGKVEQAIYKCSHEWASFPASKADSQGQYGQGANRLEGLISVYKSLGGEIA